METPIGLGLCYLFIIGACWLIPGPLLSWPGEQLALVFQRLRYLSGSARGQKLLEVLSALELDLLKGKLPTVNHSLMNYKFFSSLITGLIAASVKHGAALRSPLREIRAAVVRDLEFQKTIQESFWSGIVQFLFTSILTWGFVYFSLRVLGLTLDSTQRAFILGMQFGGCSLYLLSYFLLRERVFGKLGPLIELLYRLRSLAQVGLSIQAVVDSCGIGKLSARVKQTSPTRELVEQIYCALSSWKEAGLCPLERLGELIENGWFEMQRAQNKFCQWNEIIKFLIMAGFFLGSYLVYLFFLVSNLTGLL